MSDQASSGEPNPAPATAASAAPSAAPAADSRPIGSFGNARGSGLARGKRPAPAPAASAAPSASASGYKPSSVAVITSKSEYVNPFTGETTVSAPRPESVEATVNEPAPQAAPVSPELPTSAPVSAEVLAKEDPPVTTTTPAPVAPAGEMFPFTPSAANEPKPASPQPRPAAPAPVAEKAEIKILPPADVKRPAVSWGAGTADEDTRPQRDQRPTFQPDRREPRKFEPREPRAFEPRESRREPSLEQRGPLPGATRERDRNSPRPEPAKKSGGFIAWLKGLFGAKSAEPAPTGNRDGQYRDGRGQRDGEQGEYRRHRGGRGRGGYQGQYDNRGQREQPRDPRDEPQGGEGGGQNYGYRGDSSQGGRGYEGGGGGRRRRRGGRGRHRDDRGGPQSEGQQGGGAI